jgi:hypothetical protein
MDLAYSLPRFVVECATWPSKAICDASRESFAWVVHFPADIRMIIAHASTSSTRSKSWKSCIVMKGAEGEKD